MHPGGRPPTGPQLAGQSADCGAGYAVRRPEAWPRGWAGGPAGRGWAVQAAVPGAHHHPCRLGQVPLSGPTRCRDPEPGQGTRSWTTHGLALAAGALTGSSNLLQAQGHGAHI